MSSEIIFGIPWFEIAALRFFLGVLLLQFAVGGFSFGGFGLIKSKSLGVLGWAGFLHSVWDTLIIRFGPFLFLYIGLAVLFITISGLRESERFILLGFLLISLVSLFVY